MRKKTRNRLCLAVIVLAVLAAFAGIFYFVLAQKACFIYKGQKQTEASVTVAYGESFSLSPTDLGLSAVKGGKDITDAIVYQAVDISDVGEYSLAYQIKGGSKTFTLRIKVLDSTPPQIDGPQSWEITQGDEEAFKKAVQAVKATDNVDGDITEKINYSTGMDLNQIGSFDVTFSVADQAGNEARHIMRVTVKEKKVLEPENIFKGTGQEIVIDDPNSLTALVNKKYILPDGWAPTDLVTITSNSGRSMRLRAEAAEAWEKMCAAAKKDGITICVVSSFRTQSYQAQLFSNYYKKDSANAAAYSALPRRSEHELGLALDLSYDGSLHNNLETTAVGKWLEKHAADYGWFLRYPQGKQPVTGYIYEAWHYRYVGPELAHAIQNSGLTMEEYYNKA